MYPRAVNKSSAYNKCPIAVSYGPKRQIILTGRVSGVATEVGGGVGMWPRGGRRYVRQLLAGRQLPADGHRC